MLIEKKTSVGDIITIKMNNGDELLAKLVDAQNDKLTVSKPLQVAMSHQGFALIPYVLTINPDTMIDIDLRGVVFYTKTLQEIGNEYIKQTTNLVMVGNQN